MNKVITTFATYRKLLESRSLKRDVLLAVDYITQTKIQPVLRPTPKGAYNLLILPVSICGTQVALYNGLEYKDIALYNSELKLIILYYNYYNMHSSYDLLNTLIHEYGHATLYNSGIPKLTSKAHLDQHEFFSEMLAILYSCKMFPALRNAAYAWCRANDKREKQNIGSVNDFPFAYYKNAYYYRPMQKLFQRFVKEYPPDKRFRKLVLKST